MIVNKLAKAVQSGHMSPEQALKTFEFPGRHISEIECSLESDPLPCGFTEFEQRKYFRKNRPDLIVVAARPGHGKTSFVCQIALNVSKTMPVLVFSLEMNASSLKERLLAVELGRPIKKLQYVEKEIIENANRKLSNCNLIIDDTNGLHLNELINRTRAYKQANPDLGLVVVDYIQIVQTAQYRSKSEEVSIVARQLKELAKDLNCPVLVAAQNNRNIEGRGSFIDYKTGEMSQAKNNRPMMSDLADSAGIEKWADFIMFLQRPYLVDRTRRDETDVFVVKNRNGEAEDIILGFSGEMTKFSDYTGPQL